MERTRGRRTYALWLMPSGQVYRQLAARILDLSREYATAEFEPHVTLLGGITGPEREVRSRSADLARRMRPFVVRLTKIDYLDEYFRCVFVRVAATHYVMKANRVAREIFNLQNRPTYMPHLSLMYGNLPSRAKKRIAADLGRRFDLEFEVRRVHVILTRGEPREWRRVRAFRLK